MAAARAGWLAAALALCTLLAAAAAAADENAIAFTAAERARIAALGPWPPPALATRDPSNRASGDPAAIVLGRLLFHDAPLSANGYIACVSCHQTDRAYADGLARGRALAPIDRNTIALANLRLARWYGWGGSADSIWLAGLRALLDEREMGAQPARIVARFALNEELACRYRQVFGRAPDHADDDLLVNLAKAMAAWQQTLVTGRTAFDAFRDALLRDDGAAMARYPAAAQRGLKLFVGRAGCVQCHHGPAFSDGEFHDVGIGYFIAPGVVDPGRHAGVAALRASRFNLLGRFNDDASGASAVATRHLRDDQRQWGEWRTPSLRNVATTAPYMHNGALATLDEVLRHYSAPPLERLHGDGARLLRPLELTDSERANLVAFLESLTGAVVEPPLPPLPTSNAPDCAPTGGPGG